MKIESVSVWTVVVPTISGRVHSPEWVAETAWDQVPKQIIRLNTDTEYYGIGESGRGSVIEEVREGAQKLLGRDPERMTLQDIFNDRADGTEKELEVGLGPRSTMLSRWPCSTSSGGCETFPFTPFSGERFVRGYGPITGLDTRPPKTARGRWNGHSSMDSRASRSSARSRSRCTIG